MSQRTRVSRSITKNSADDVDGDQDDTGLFSDSDDENDSSKILIEENFLEDADENHDEQNSDQDQNISDDEYVLPINPEPEEPPYENVSQAPDVNNKKNVPLSQLPQLSGLLQSKRVGQPPPKTVKLPIPGYEHLEREKTFVPYVPPKTKKVVSFNSLEVYQPANKTTVLFGKDFNKLLEKIAKNIKNVEQIVSYEYHLLAASDELNVFVREFLDSNQIGWRTINNATVFIVGSKQKTFVDEYIKTQNETSPSGNVVMTATIKPRHSVTFDVIANYSDVINAVIRSGLPYRKLQAGASSRLSEISSLPYFKSKIMNAQNEGSFAKHVIDHVNAHVNEKLKKYGVMNQENLSVCDIQITKDSLAEKDIPNAYSVFDTEILDVSPETKEIVWSFDGIEYNFIVNKSHKPVYFYDNAFKAYLREKTDIADEYNAFSSELQKLAENHAAEFLSDGILLDKTSELYTEDLFASENMAELYSRIMANPGGNKVYDQNTKMVLVSSSGSEETKKHITIHSFPIFLLLKITHDRRQYISKVTGINQNLLGNVGVVDILSSGVGATPRGEISERDLGTITGLLRRQKSSNIQQIISELSESNPFANRKLTGIDTVAEYLDNSIKEYRQHISDHSAAFNAYFRERENQRFLVSFNVVMNYFLEKNLPNAEKYGNIYEFVQNLARKFAESSAERIEEEYITYLSGFDRTTGSVLPDELYKPIKMKLPGTGVTYEKYITDAIRPLFYLEQIPDNLYFKAQLLSGYFEYNTFGSYTDDLVALLYPELGLTLIQNKLSITDFSIIVHNIERYIVGLSKELFEECVISFTKDNRMLHGGATKPVEYKNQNPMLKLISVWEMCGLNFSGLTSQEIIKKYTTMVIHFDKKTGKLLYYDVNEIINQIVQQKCDQCKKQGVPVKKYPCGLFEYFAKARVACVEANLLKHKLSHRKQTGNVQTAKSTTTGGDRLALPQASIQIVDGIKWNYDKPSVVYTYEGMNVYIGGLGDYVSSNTTDIGNAMWDIVGYQQPITNKENRENTIKTLSANKNSIVAKYGRKVEPLVDGLIALYKSHLSYEELVTPPETSLFGELTDIPAEKLKKAENVLITSIREINEYKTSGWQYMNNYDVDPDVNKANLYKELSEINAAR